MNLSLMEVTISLRNIGVVPPWLLEVLLVEDDEADAYLIMCALEKNPLVGKVVVANDDVEALELFDKGRISPDLAIVDLHMPRKNGFAILRDFAARGRRPFPSVIITSSGSGADADRAKHLGAAEFITKPNTPAKLVAALDRVILQRAQAPGDRGGVPVQSQGRYGFGPLFRRNPFRAAYA